MRRLHVLSPRARFEPTCVFYVLYPHLTTKCEKKKKHLHWLHNELHKPTSSHSGASLRFRCTPGIYRSIMNTDGRLMRCTVIISNKKMVNGSINPMTRAGEGCVGDSWGRDSLARNLLEERRRKKI